ncbi:hypothetical protein ACJX0J_010074, partial [Zea mays]
YFLYNINIEIYEGVHVGPTDLRRFILVWAHALRLIHGKDKTRITRTTQFYCTSEDMLYIYYTRIGISDIIKDLKCLLMKGCASSKNMPLPNLDLNSGHVNYSTTTHFKILLILRLRNSAGARADAIETKRHF